jgi:hypothetical protein
MILARGCGCTAESDPNLNTPATQDTPRRFVRALFDATEGYDGDPKLLEAHAAVRLFVKRFSVQERIGQQVADALETMLQPHGVAVYLEAHHLCVEMRGVREMAPMTCTTVWLAGWIFLVLFFGFFLAINVWLFRHNPGLLQERMRLETFDQQGWDKVLFPLLQVFIFAWLIFMSLDAVCFHWSPVPVWLQFVGAIVLVCSFRI